jgi:CDP-diacylglycerol---glycerol-3-phosphate 3-phosphatidyltransferase
VCLVATLYDIKPRFQALLLPVCRAAVRSGVSANELTLLALAISVGQGALMASFPHERWPLLLLPAALFVRIALNALDGMVARERGSETAAGALLNELGDVISDGALYLPLALVPGFPAALVVLATFFAAVSEVAGVLAVHVCGSRRNDGPMGKSDRALVLGAVALAAGLGVPAGPWTTAALASVLALLVATVVNRARGALGAAAAHGR